MSIKEEMIAAMASKAVEQFVGLMTKHVEKLDGHKFSVEGLAFKAGEGANSVQLEIKSLTVELKMKADPVATLG